MKKLTLTLLFLISLSSTFSSSEKKTIFKLKDKDCFEYLKLSSDKLSIQSVDSFHEHLDIAVVTHDVLHDVAAVQLEEELALDERLNECVEDYSEDGFAYLTQDPTWHLRRTNVKELPLPTDFIRRINYTDSYEVHVFVVDSGVTKHVDLVDKLAPNDHIAYVQETNCTGFDPFCDKNSHGTHVAGLVASDKSGYGNKVKLHAVKVFTASGSTNWSNVLSAINKIIEYKLNNYSNNPVIANFSLAGSKNTVLNTAFTKLDTNGILAVVSAGNFATKACDYSPASTEVLLTVGSSTFSDTISSFSNTGECVDLYAPGSILRSTFSDGKTYVYKSGTSMSSPFVAGYAAALAGHFKLTNPREIISKVFQYTVSNVNNGKIPLLISDYAFVPSTTNTTTTPAPTPTPTSNNSSSLGDSINFDFVQLNK